jgi:predicted transglutaminase-like cysteine proteinase
MRKRWTLQAGLATLMGVACLAACTASTRAGSSIPLPPTQLEQQHEPFDLPTSPMPDGEMKTKWLSVESELDDEGARLAACRLDRLECTSTVALRFLALVDRARARDGRARIGEINQDINLAIHPMSDMAQFGKPDVWSSPLTTLARGSGDCEDYAIAKYLALKEIGVAEERLRIVVVSDALSGEGHAVAAVRLDGHWWLLDNRRMDMIQDMSAKYYRPLFVLGRHLALKYESASSAADASKRLTGATNPR